MREIVGVFVVTRAALAIVVLAAVSWLPIARCVFCADLSMVPILAALARWDSAGYLELAQNGYAVVGRENLAAYFPLYPALMRIGGTLLGGGSDAYLITGIVVANGALLAAAVALARLAAVRHGPAIATRAAVFLLVFPTTIFLSAVYADSLFLAFAILAALAAERRQWWRSGLFAACAALTRPFGGLALLPLAVLLWRERATVRRSDFAALLLAPLAFLAWVLYLYAVTGDPLAILRGYVSGFEPRPPLQSFLDLLDPSVYGFPWFVAGLFALFLVLVARSWRVAGAPLAAYATAMLVVIGAAGSLTSSMRYEMSIYPAFIVLAALTRGRAAPAAWVVVSAALAVVFAAMYALYHWVG